jgi:hypothetical protein
MTKIEIWKDIEGYEGLYKISTFGRIKNKKNEMSEGWFVNGKYKKVRLYKDRQRKDFYVHRLVALAFIDNPLNKSDVNHIDSNPENNMVSNLEWCTHQENMAHASRNNRINKEGTKVQHKSTGKIFDSITDAANFANIKQNTLTYQLLRGSSVCEFQYL